MHRTSANVSPIRTLICLTILAFITAIFVLPSALQPAAAKGLVIRTKSHDENVPNYDIRTDKASFEKLAAYRATAGKNVADVTDIRDSFVRGEAKLRATVPTLKVEYNDDIRTPEVIGPDVKQGRGFLTSPSTAKRSGILQSFLKQNSELVGVSGEQIDGLRVFADYANPDGNLAFVELDQEINGIPVFRGEVKAGFTRKGELVRVVNNLAPGLDYGSLSTDFGDPAYAVRSAAGSINADTSKLNLAINGPLSSDIKTVFGVGDSATTAEKMYFPTEPGVAVAAWRVLIWQPVNAYYVIVDAQSGTVLWRKNITEDQTQSATYSVYANPNAMINVADSPSPFSPGPNSPNGQQGTPLPRSLITRIGNEAPYTFNNLGWITDGITVTDGNAVQAGLDRDGIDGVDTNSEAVSPTRNFNAPYNPFIPATGLGEDPVPATQTYPGSNFQQGSVTQLFYICNWYHDEMYRLGFTEQARNFQNDNFGRGGVAADRVRGEGQDSVGTNNANFSTPADGGRGRMQMYIWTGPNPDIDGNLDAEVVIHEHTHGLSNRLHGNGSGLGLNMSRGMGEGWSDFYAQSLLSEPSDPINGIYAMGGYDTYLGSTGFVNNYYYGIRRFPKAVKAFTGGPGNLPHNPLTFADADAAQLNTSDGAFPRGPYGSSTADQVHNLGEIWSSALWEVRAKMITRLGWANGNRKVLQLVTDGMKLAPLGPTFLSERDAILAAAQASSLAPDAANDVADVWAGFAIRGMGYGATIQNNGTGSGDTRVTEAFDLPNLFQTPNLTISDTAGNNNGSADPGESITINIPLTNSTGNTVTGVTLQIVGGGAATYGTIASGTTVSQGISYAVPAGAACGSLISLTLNVNSSLGATSFGRSIVVGQPVVSFTETFDAVTAPAIPAGWTATALQSGTNFVTTTVTPDAGTNAAFALDPTTVGGGTDLTSPVIPITAMAATVTFRQKYDTEGGWDGGVLEISIGGGAFQDILAAGGSFVQNGYNGTLGTGTNNPLSNRAAWNGVSGGYLTTIARLPAAAAGQNVQLKWRFGADDNIAGTGWWIDSVQVSGSYNCTIVDNFSKTRADFDGDRKSDISVYRPSEGNWYLNRSTAGFTGVHFGDVSDVIVPGDFDGDGKADISVWRPSTGTWFRLNSGNGQFVVTQFGTTGDIPQATDFDGDHKDDLAVFRPSSGTWYWLNSSNGQFNAVQFGQNGDRPVAGDYDGDGKSDVCVYRPANGAWYRLNSDNGQFYAVGFGLSTDLPVPADYDGDGKQDVAVFRPSNGMWYRLNSSNGQFAAVQFGASGDIPAAGDYDGDGKDDQAVYRAGVWYLNRSTTGFSATAFGQAGDVPVPAKYIP